MATREADARWEGSIKDGKGQVTLDAKLVQ